MRTLRLLLAVVLLLMPVPAQEDETPFFSLSSDRTYAPGEKVTVRLAAHRVTSLEFRVYRVQDPEAFFTSLDQPHEFGGRAPRPAARARTPLERFHAFKLAIRQRIRNALRTQFTSDSRSEIRAALAERSAPKVVTPRKSEYASVPLLNPQRLVTTWQQPVNTPNRWDQQVVPVDLREKGLYLIEATDGKLRAYTIALITEIAVLSKSAPGRVFAQVVNRRSGRPVPQAAAVVFADGKEVSRAETSPDGVIDVSVEEASIEHVLVLARRGADFAADALWGHNISSDPGRTVTGYVYTDRPVYRPSHNVSFRAILRAQAGPGYFIPSIREVDVQVDDPEGNAVFRKKLPLSGFGTLDGELTLDANAALGYYSVEISSGEARASGGFQVEEYKKPEYEVKVNPDQRRVLQGQPIAATIDARYYFGEAVANGKVSYAVHRSRYWPPYFEEEPEEEQEGDEGGGGYGSEQVGEGTGQLDAEGRLKISVPTQEQAHDQRYRIEARVTDASNREIAGSGFVIATVGSFLLNVQPAQYVYEAGSTATIEIEARDYEGKPVDAGFEVTVSEYRWNKPPGRTIFTGGGRTGVTGKGSVRPRFPDGGSYVVHAVARAAEGRQIQDTAHVWVTGEGGMWYSERRERLQIVADKKSYRAGDTARLLVVTGVPEARVIVSVEGRDLHSVEVVQAKQPSITVEVPIKSEYAPNVYFSAAFIRDNQLFQGTRTLKVPPVERQLAVDLTSSKPQYKPGEPAVFDIAARDHTGKPVTAEFSLGVVDEAIYSIRREMAQDILRFFYGFGYNRVTTGSSLQYYFWGQAGKRTMQLAQVRERRLAQLKPERFVDPAVRKAFPDTAFWAAGLKTDAQGRVKARFAFPDALTTWRATARGVTMDTRVGSAVHKVIVRKNLILRLSTPRFFTQGDEVTVSALVHNYLADAKKVRVSLDVDGADVLEGATRDVNVASKADARLDWRLRPRPGQQITLLGKALTDEESDAMEISLPVHPYGVKMAEARTGSISEAAGKADADLGFPGDASPGSRSLEISVTPSLAGAIFGALDYLTSFPYGCVEQTMSSFLPNVIVSRAARDLGLKVDEGELTGKIRAGLERLNDFQHEDGGWGWWKTDDSDPFMTAYVVAGLSQARAAGVNVPPYPTERGAEWLRKAYDGMKGEADLRAYIAYALAVAGDKSVLDSAAGMRSDLTPYGLAVLGLAMRQAGDDRAAGIADELLKRVREEGSEAWWHVERDTLMRFHGDTTPEATAYAVKLIAAVRPDSPVLEKAIAWLMNHRREGYYWASTKQTAMVIYGITDYLKLSGELKPDYSVSVQVNGREVLSRRFAAADALAPKPPVIRIPEAQLAGANRITVTKNGAGKLYWSARAEYHRPATEAIGNANLRLAREYFRLAPERDANNRITYGLQPFEGPVAPGDVIAVRLTLEAPDLAYLMVEDPIAAGTEFIERDDLYEIRSRPPWWRYWFTRREFRDNRAALFQTRGSSKPIEYFYLLKVVNPGVFKVSPARAGPMYQPERFATTEPRNVEVRQ